MSEMKFACGFCTVGSKHEYCPGAIWNNGNILSCPCKCTDAWKCRDCGSRADVSKTNLKCGKCEGSN